ncbi:MAG: glycerate kinase [Saprospiraceae bacterium]|nr:glycerate kinase [Saprospiraceae bacterium]
MKVLLAPDSFKDCLTALAVCEAMERGVKRALPSANVQFFPLADGGEGTAEVLAWHLGGELVEVSVNDPLFRPVRANYLRAGNLAFVEMAQASGLQRLGVGERNSLKTSTFGTGELIRHAVAHGAEEVCLAIGGSATNDAGMGMAAALGWQFLDENGKELLPIGGNLQSVASVVAPNKQSEIENLKVVVLCDVNNPLFGPRGAAHVFAEQKGADAAAIERLDKGLWHFSDIFAKQTSGDYALLPGAGAAGGLGFGAMAFLNAQLRSGAERILQLTDFEDFVKQADLILTGEGRLDAQTGHGKLLAAICRTANRNGVPVVAICGSVEATEREVKALGLATAIGIREPGEPLEAAIARSAKALEELAYNVLKPMLF